MAVIDLKFATIALVDGTPTTPNVLTISIGEGNLDFTEKRTIEVVKRRGVIETAREGDELEMDVGLQFVWEHVSAGTADDPPSIEDALKRRGAAAAWASTNPDPDAPYCLDVRVTYTPPCSGQHSETITLRKFQYEDLAHSLRDATVDCKGRCLATQAAG